MAKPDGLLVVPIDGERAFLHPLPVELLWGVGAVTAGEAARPRACARSRDVAALGEPALVSLLGPAAGRHLHALARGPRPAAGAGRAAAPVDGCAAGARPAGRAPRPRSRRCWPGWSTG